MSACHVFPSLQLCVYLLIYLHLLFQFDHALPLTADIAPETGLRADFFSSEACGSCGPPDRRTYVVNVHHDSQLSGLKADDPRSNRRV